MGNWGDADGTPFGRWGDHCPWGGHDWRKPCNQDCYDAGKDN